MKKATMLEVRNLTKVYKTKGGADVRALDGVSLALPETGMVFLLGKSGSGKSTLLNVCGGLDSPTSGEIVVKGRSSAGFTQSDFDSYRNTFVGFVFQEYNILDEFTVENNIALALELQGKSKDRETVNRLLEEVDLAGYARRKPNTLSGGQKQRIAIARALVKNPEIIMADEPTGALDSATGKQVFDTLKKLSEKKLVIVVSHDRDFAEQYADRIIELKDGKVISDVSKTEEKSRTVGDNISVSGNTLCVKAGAKLTEKDFLAIKDFLSNTENGAVIAGGKRDVSLFKQIARISDDGDREVFTDTKADKILQKSYTAEESGFIRSKLPLRHAAKIGASSLKSKPVRLIFTVLLSVVSFVMFGLLSTMMLYDKQEVLAASLEQSDYTVLSLSKKYLIHFNDSSETYDGQCDTSFTPDDIDALKNDIPNIIPALSFPYSQKIDGADYTSSSDYYTPDIRHLIRVSDAESLRGSITHGRFPEAKDEICISSYQAETLIHGGFRNKDTQESEKPSSEKDLLNKKIGCSSVFESITIVGIYDCGKLPSRYDEIRDKTYYSGTLGYFLQLDRESGLYTASIVTDKVFASVKKSMEQTVDFYARLSDGTTILNYIHLENYEASLSDCLFADGVNRDLLSTDEIVVSTDIFKDIYSASVDKKEQQFTEEEATAFLEDYCNTITRSGYSVDDTLSNLSSKRLREENKDGWSESRELTEEEFALFYKVVMEFAEKYDLDLTGFSLTCDDDRHEFSQNTAVVGINIDEDQNVLTEEKVYKSVLKDYLRLYPEADKNAGSGYAIGETAYVISEDVAAQTVFIPFDHSEKTLDFIKRNVNLVQADDCLIVVNGAIVASLNNVNAFVEEASEIFLWIGLIMAVFSALLLCNFIAVSISYKKKEIGILRAIGARGFDVFKIFFSESLVITAVCVLLSVIGCFVACSFINAEVAGILSGVTLFVFGPLSVLMMIGVALLTAVVATFLPVWNAAKKKPVESIRAL